MKAGPTPPSLPPGIHNAYWFQAFNAVSWQICVGNPLILFARELGATATTIGLLVGLAPLLSIIQLPVSRYAAFFGMEWLLILATTILLVRLKEPRSQPASSMIYEVFVGWPARSLSQLLQLFR